MTTSEDYAPPMPNARPPGTLSRAQVAERLGLSLVRIDEMARDGLLTKHSNKLTRLVWFDADEVDQLARDRAAASTDDQRGES